MIVFQTIAVAFGMFSALPLPQPAWTPRNMRYALCAFPLVGLVCGLCWWGWTALAEFLAMPDLLRGAGLCLVPVLVTGGIHLDGYADTCDALASCAPQKRKQEILADPHCGAFAVIRLCVYFVWMLALCTVVETGGNTPFCVGLAFVLERSLSGYAIAVFPLAKDSGLAHSFATAADRRRVKNILLLLICASAGGMAALGDIGGKAMALAALAALVWYWRVAKKQFGGVSGDLAGWFLQVAELWQLTALVVAQLLLRALGTG